MKVIDQLVEYFHSRGALSPAQVEYLTQQGLISPYLLAGEQERGTFSMA
jgi:hypothetical protein